MSQIAVLEGYTMRRTKHRRTGKAARKHAMKACAKHHKVTTRGFHACVRKKLHK